MNLQIIGIAGTNGSGKDTTGLTLADRHSYLFISVTDLLRAELNRRSLPVERENLRALSAEWRREHGYPVLVDRAIAEYNRLKANYVGLAIASLRNPYEADRIHELGGVVLWVDADPKIRYLRIQNNAEARARAGEDAKSYEEFIAEEEAEMHSATHDPAALDMAAVKKKADIFLVNDNTDLQHFQDFITQQLFGEHDPSIINRPVHTAETPHTPTVQIQPQTPPQIPQNSQPTLPQPPPQPPLTPQPPQAAA